jgi:hypothetical protein
MEMEMEVAPTEMCHISARRRSIGESELVKRTHQERVHGWASSWMAGWLIV